MAAGAPRNARGDQAARRALPAGAPLAWLALQQACPAPRPVLRHGLAGRQRRCQLLAVRTPPAAAGQPRRRPAPPQWLMARPERHLAVVSHGGLLLWMLSTCGGSLAGPPMLELRRWCGQGPSSCPSNALHVSPALPSSLPIAPRLLPSSAYPPRPLCCHLHHPRPVPLPCARRSG